MTNIVCFAIDRLHAGYIGALGNTWIATPQLNRLAADAFVFDRAMVDTPDLRLGYRSLWRGVHAMTPERHIVGPSLPEALAAAGYHTALWSDDRQVAELPLAEAFHERELIDLPPAGEVAASVDETQLSLYALELAKRLPELPEPFFLWAHIGSLGRVWDAPLEMREQYADEDDPRPPEIYTAPGFDLPRDFDPDMVLGLSHAYAGQVTLLDECLGWPLEALIGGQRGDRTALAIYSPRGFPLGEHGRIGAGHLASERQPLYSELTHAPLIIRLPQLDTQGFRSPALVQPPDLCATIAELAGVAPTFAGDASPRFGMSLIPAMTGERMIVRDRACIIGAGAERAITTPAWHMLMQSSELALAASPLPQASSLQPQASLYVKPDDWHEINEVANRCPEAVEGLQAAYKQFESACEADTADPLPPLPEILVNGIA